MNRHVWINLRRSLTLLYPDSNSIRRISADAGIDLTHVSLNSSPINNWDTALMEADKLILIDSLIEVVKNEYKDNIEFKKAYMDYQELISQDSESRYEEEQKTIMVQENQFRPVSNSPSRLLRECLQKSFDNDSIRAFCYDYFNNLHGELQGTDRLNQIITLLMNHCYQNGQIEILWQNIKVERPLQYSNYYPQWDKVVNRQTPNV